MATTAYTPKRPMKPLATYERVAEIVNKYSRTFIAVATVAGVLVTVVAGDIYRCFHMLETYKLLASYNLEFVLDTENSFVTIR